MMIPTLAYQLQVLAYVYLDTTILCQQETDWHDQLSERLAI